MTRPVSLFQQISSAALLAGLVLQSATSIAQTHKVAAPERVTRAIAVYEWTGPIEKPTADRLVPVSIYIGGRMEAADVYLARPVPLALQTGNIYEVDEAGLKKGTFDVDHARNSRSFTKEIGDTSASGWYGFGSFRAPSATAKAPVLQASRQLPTISSTGGSTRPRFSSKADKDNASSANAPQPASKPDASSTSSDADRPKLNRPSDQTPSPSTTSSRDDDIDRPTLRKRDPAEDAQRRKAASQSGVRGPDVSLNDDPDRPTMRHGKPAAADNAQDLAGLPADMHQSAAVSDAVNRPEHLFSRDWESASERANTLLKLQSLARPAVAKYIAANQLVPGAPLPVTSPVAPPMPAAVATPPTASDDENAPKLQRGVPKEYQKPSAATKPAPPVKAAPSVRRRTPASKSAAAKTVDAPLTLSSEQLTPYTLSYGGLPTFVYTAQTNLKTGGPVYVTLVAQRMVTGEYQVSLSSITDASHLDRTPWLRLVDAVDPDASHRASLLFELRGQTSRQFALYRLTSAQAEQTFITNTM